MNYSLILSQDSLHKTSEFLVWTPAEGSAVTFQCLLSSTLSFTVGSDSKESTCNAGDLGSMPGLERSPGEGNSYTLQFSCLENPMDRGAWWATVHRVAKSQT